MKAAIENFANMPYARKVLVLGAMAELGADSLQEHQQIVDEIAKKDWDSVLLVGGDFRAIRHPYLSFPNADEAGAWLKNNPISHAYLLIKGSRSMQMEKTLTYL
jgi:UDP-N-acetylmuramoyl-tripeptide--D-alanyl-D-alanine ligase